MSTNRPETDGIDHLFGRPTPRKSAGAPATSPAGGAESSGLRELRRGFEEAAREARRIAEGLSAHQVNWRPAAGRWSIAECFGHLNMFGSEMLPVIDEAIFLARSRGWCGNGPFRAGFVGRWLLKGTEPPVRRKRRALDQHVPRSDQDAKDVLSALVDLNGLLASRVEAANGLDVSRPKISLPGVRLFRLSLLEVFLFIAAHGRRHLAQARVVRENPLFPKPSPGPEQASPSVLARPFR